MSSTASRAMLLPRVCPGCEGEVPLAVTASAGTFYLGWICPRCLAADTDGYLIDVMGVYGTRDDAEWDRLSEEHYASLEPPDMKLDTPAPEPARPLRWKRPSLALRNS